MIKYKGDLPEISLKLKKGGHKKCKISSSKNAEEFFRSIFDEDTLEIYETFMVVFLNNSNNTLGFMKLSQGGITGTLVDVRLLMVSALQCGAVSIIMAHNHPSGGLKPSEADKSLTQKIKLAANTLDISVLDHLIITENGYYSFADENQL